MSSPLVLGRSGDPSFHTTHRAAVTCGVVGLHLALAGWAWQASPAPLLNTPAPMTVLQWVQMPAAVSPAPAPEPAPAALPLAPAVAERPKAQRVTEPRVKAPPAPVKAPAPEAESVPVTTDAAAPAPAPTPTAAAPAPSEALMAAAPGAGVATPTSAPSPAAVAEAEAPTIPSQSVQYLVPPQPRYPAASRRLEEAGEVLVQVWVTEGGLPQKVQVRRSSGFQRLDAAAVAAVEGARFKPYVTAGRPTAGWTYIPLSFDLENS
ncbi:MAG: energy transducer TonB [Pseudomonadota bacterium]